MLAAHVVFGAFGFWLPNDPRGSWSAFVGSYELTRFGPATRTRVTRSVADRAHDHARRLAAKRALQRPAVEFTGLQARAIGRGFAEYAAPAKLKILACAILPDHVHLVLAAHRLGVDPLIARLKRGATQRLVAEGLHPFANIPSRTGRPPKCFARGQWKVYLDDEAAVRRAIAYVNANPEKQGKRRQNWSFVTPWEG